MVEIRELLRCPCSSHAALDYSAYGSGEVRCTALGCRYSAAPGFPVVNGRVALVDFDNSVLDRDALIRSSAGSVLKRRRRLDPLEVIRATLLEQNRVAKRNGRRLAELLARNGGPAVVLIVGGGTIGSGTEVFYGREDIRVVAFDVYASEHTDFIADAHGIPLADAAVDAVWIQGVLPYVLAPDTVAAEIHRVLKPDGLLYSETGLLQQVFEGAYDFTRHTDSGHRWLFRGFECIESGVVSGPGTAAMWSLKNLASGLLRSHKLGTAAALPFFWLRFLDRLMPDGHARDGAYATFLLGRKTASAIGPKDIIRHYKGSL